MLYLPKETTILATQDGKQDISFAGAHWLDIKVSHPDLPERKEGERIAQHDPQFRSELVDGEHYETHFVSWD